MIRYIIVGEKEFKKIDGLGLVTHQLDLVLPNEFFPYTTIITFYADVSNLEQPMLIC